MRNRVCYAPFEGVAPSGGKEGDAVTRAKSNLRKNFDWYYANLGSLLSGFVDRHTAFPKYVTTPLRRTVRTPRGVYGCSIPPWLDVTLGHGRDEARPSRIAIFATAPMGTTKATSDC